MERLSYFTFGILYLLTVYANPVKACTDFLLKANDGTIVIARSMEFSTDFNSNVRTAASGKKFTSVGPDGKPAMSWTGKYGYLYLDGMGVDAAIDGMNEKGLTFEALLLPNLAEYQTVAAGKNASAVPYLMLGDWVLSNFASVSEVKNAISKITVFAQKVPSLGDTIFPLHFAIYDASGAGIVIEYIKGQLAVYDNTVGVMTNAPAYGWHMTNLDNYVNLKPTNPSPILINGNTFIATGQGAGMLGLPGDISPPSRFVKISVLKAVAIPAKDKGDVINLAQHIINNVDIPYGLARENSTGNYTNEYTQWVVFKDVTNKVWYYRTYKDLSLRSVDLTKLDFSATAPNLKMPINGTQPVQDMTNNLLQTKAK